MGKEGFDDEGGEKAFNVFDLLWLSCAFLDPGLCIWPGLVQREQTSLSSSFNELIWFCDEGGVENPGWEVMVAGESVGGLVPLN